MRRGLFQNRFVPRPIRKLSDHFGQFDIVLVCGACGHRRETEPITLARRCRVPNDSLIEDVVKRLKCSKCGLKKCSATATLPTRPRGYSSLPR